MHLFLRFAPVCTVINLPSRADWFTGLTLSDLSFDISSLHFHELLSSGVCAFRNWWMWSSLALVWLIWRSRLLLTTSYTKRLTPTTRSSASLLLAARSACMITQEHMLAWCVLLKTDCSLCPLLSKKHLKQPLTFAVLFFKEKYDALKKQYNNLLVSCFSHLMFKDKHKSYFTFGFGSVKSSEAIFLFFVFFFVGEKMKNVNFCLKFPPKK